MMEHTEFIDKNVERISRKLAEVGLGMCKDCEKKEQCWENPYIGVPKTIDGIFKVLIEDRKAIIISLTTLKLITLIKEQKEKEEC